MVYYLFVGLSLNLDNLLVLHLITNIKLILTTLCITQYSIKHLTKSNMMFLTITYIIINTMSRAVPWRNKPSNLISQMLPVANQLKLYLVNEIGPTSFLFKDDFQNKFKVVIGSTISCSCAVVQNDHCIHSLYVLLKKYKVPATNPIIWQASYLDSQLQGLIHYKYMEKKHSQHKKYIPKKKIPNPTQEDDFPPLEEDASCPICYENLQGQCYSTCGTCRKSIHSKCFKVWALHKQDNNSKVTCPMCRTEFHNPLAIIYHDLQKWQQRFATHKGTFCKTCATKNIKGLLYRCLLCENTDLCKLCYEGNQHPEHQQFFVKDLASQPWKIAPIRIKKTRRQLFHPIKQLQVKDLLTVESNQFIIGLFPTLKQYASSQNSSELGIVGNDILTKHMCFKCKTVGGQSMRRLNCGHSVHEQCLEQMIKSNDFICEIDNETICPGYLSAMGIKVQKKKSRTTNCKFITNQGSQIRMNSIIESQQNTKSGIRNLSIENNLTYNKNPKRKENIKASSSKDRNFRIMKKNVMERRQPESFGVIGMSSPMLIMGFGQSPQLNPMNLPIPKSRPVFHHNV